MSVQILEPAGDIRRLNYIFKNDGTFLKELEFQKLGSHPSFPEPVAFRFSSQEFKEWNSEVKEDEFYKFITDWEVGALVRERKQSPWVAEGHPGNKSTKMLMWALSKGLWQQLMSHGEDDVAGDPSRCLILVSFTFWPLGKSAHLEENIGTTSLFWYWPQQGHFENYCFGVPILPGQFMSPVLIIDISVWSTALIL